MRSPDTETEPLLHTLANGVRVLIHRLPGRPTADVSVFVHTGSQHEAARDNGISHVVEHMAFKGTATRDCQRINLDAEALGAQVNAHTDKDHSAFHMFGLAADASGVWPMPSTGASLAPPTAGVASARSSTPWSTRSRSASRPR